MPAPLSGAGTLTAGTLPGAILSTVSAADHLAYSTAAVDHLAYSTAAVDSLS